MTRGPTLGRMSDAAAIVAVETGSTLAMYLASGKKKHDRLFWVSPSDGTLAWDKKKSAKPNKIEPVLSVGSEPAVKNARQWFESMDADGSGEIDEQELAELYQQARGEKLSKKQLKAAMAAMDQDGGGTVDFEEFDAWWRANGGDLEKHKELALTVVAGDVTLLLVAHDIEAKMMWVNGLTAMLRSLGKLPPAAEPEAPEAAAVEPEPEPESEPAPETTDATRSASFGAEAAAEGAAEQPAAGGFDPRGAVSKSPNSSPREARDRLTTSALNRLGQESPEDADADDAMNQTDFLHDRKKNEAGGDEPMTEWDSAQSAMVASIFGMCDTDGSGVLTKAEYKSYLQGVKEWGAGNYIDSKFNRQWVAETTSMDCDPKVGITWQAFKMQLYGNYRTDPNVVEQDLTFFKQRAEKKNLRNSVEDRRAKKELEQLRASLAEAVKVAEETKKELAKKDRALLAERAQARKQREALQAALQQHTLGGDGAAESDGGAAPGADAPPGWSMSTMSEDVPPAPAPAPISARSLDKSPSSARSDQSGTTIARHFSFFGTHFDRLCPVSETGSLSNVAQTHPSSCSR